MLGWGVMKGLRRLLGAVAAVVWAGCASVPGVTDTPEWEQVRSATTNRVLGTALPKGFRTLYIMPVFDDTGERELGRLLHDRLVALFGTDGRLVPVAEFGEAQGVLAVKIGRLLRQTLSWDDRKFPDRVLISMSVRVLLRDVERDRDLMRKEIEERVEYRRVSEPVEDEGSAMRRLLDRVATNILMATVGEGR